MRFADLVYTDAELEQDAVHYLQTQVYEPAFISEVKSFIADDLADFKRYYDDDSYIFHNVYYDEYVLGYDEGSQNDNIRPRVDFVRMSHDLEEDFQRLNMSEDEVERYCLQLDAEFRKNSFLSHMEPYFLGEDAVISTVIAGYSRNPIFSIYSSVREWAMALHFKKMYPVWMRKFGYRYQYIQENYSGDEKLKILLDYRDKYKLTFKNIGVLRAVHSSVFAYVYMYLRAVLTQETEQIEDFIMDNSTAQFFLLLQGENIKTVDFAVVRYVLQQLKQGRYKQLIFPRGNIDWDGVYEFVMEAINATGGLENLRAFGADGIAAKTIRSFWNKSSNMQKMLKILRRLAMGHSDPVISQLIEMCEYRLGRPNDKSKKKMERFIEHTRKLLNARAYELTQPRAIAQELIAAFPSVFLVYFQWHHNFRNIYPPVSVQQKSVELQKNIQRQAEDTLRNRINIEENARRQLMREELLRDMQRRQDNDAMHNRTEQQMQQKIQQENAILLSEKNKRQNF